MKFMKLLLVLMMIINVMPIHVHDEYCGYDENTDTGCIYDIDPLKQGDGNN